LGKNGGSLKGRTPIGEHAQHRARSARNHILVDLRADGGPPAGVRACTAVSSGNHGVFAARALPVAIFDIHLAAKTPLDHHGGVIAGLLDTEIVEAASRWDH